MKNCIFKRMVAAVLCPIMILAGLAFPASAEEGWWFAPAIEAQASAEETSEEPLRDTLALDCKSAILMEASTGKVLYEQNADEALPPASVTKVMTLLLVMEAIDEGKIKLDDTVTASAHAASMGGSQIFLKEGEQMSVEDMLKSVVIASANDAACALAEFVEGSEEAFVKAMNDRAAELGMKNTVFENTNGLDDTAENHLTSARDIAIMSRELIKHERILEYSSIWMDTVRNGLFGLTNTNRLVRYYKGCTGLKTGSTSKAGFCISATAERNGMSLICVIMGSPTRDVRNAEATKLLDFGFANFGVYNHAQTDLDPIKVVGGKQESVGISCGGFSYVGEKSALSAIKCNVDLPESVSAPIKKGDKVGDAVFLLNGKEIGRVEIVATDDVDKLGYFGIWQRMMGRFFMK